MDDTPSHNLQALLDKHRANLHTLELQAANYGASPPLHLINDIVEIRNKIAMCEHQIAEGEHVRANLVPDDAIVIDVCSFAPAAFAPPGDYRLDWTTQLAGKTNDPDRWHTAWPTVIADLHQLKQQLDAHAGHNPHRLIPIAARIANTHLPIGYALGFTFGDHTRFTLWATPSNGMTGQYWNARHTVVVPAPLLMRHLPDDGGGDIVIEIAINNPTTRAVDRWLAASHIRVAARLHFALPGDPARTVVESAAEAWGIARQIGAVIRRLRGECDPCPIHLFGAVPVGLAALIGTQLNIGADLRLYEYVQSIQHYLLAGSLIYE